MFKHLHLDIEVYSEGDLPSTGVYPYAEHPSTQVTLLGAWLRETNQRVLVSLAEGETLPEWLVAALLDPFVIKHAYNAQFERVVLRDSLGIDVPIEQWRCTMLATLYAGIPGNLAQAAEVLGLEQGKMREGKALITYFCMPCKPTKTNGGRTRNLPSDNPEKWALFKKYCERDVEVEANVYEALKNFEVPEYEYKLAELDQRINDRGIGVDYDLVGGALAVNDQVTEEVTNKLKEITGLENPNSAPQFKEWINEREGQFFASLSKDVFSQVVEACQDPDVLEALNLYQQLGKTSISKYKKMVDYRCSDDRVRGLIQFYGANRTGRWAGRGIQIHNLPKNFIPGLDAARKIVKAADRDLLELYYGSAEKPLSQLIRTAFVPQGKAFVVIDFSAIEARVLAWLSGCQWRLDVFKTHGKIYEASASAMFGVPIEKIARGNPEFALRQKGKVAELALGYQGGPNALITMGALNMGLDESELPEIVGKWRGANPEIESYWHRLEKAARAVIERKTKRGKVNNVAFTYENNCLQMHLPSGRRYLNYWNARIEKGKIRYDGLNQMSRRWETTATYGGKLTENLCQAVSRDCLADALFALEAEGLQTVTHVHDEVVIECGKDQDPDEVLRTCERVLGRELEWAEGLPLKGDGFVSDFYKKDD